MLFVVKHRVYQALRKRLGLDEKEKFGYRTTLQDPFKMRKSECSQKYFARHQFHFLTVNSDRLRLSARASKSAWKNSHVPRGESYAGIFLPLCITLAPGC